MKTTLFFLILMIVVFGSCRKSSVEDYSLSLEEYQKMSVPEPNKIWSLKDYSDTFDALTKLKFQKPFALPIKDSKRSGVLLSRMINIENMSFLKDESIPLYEKAQLSKRYLEVYRELIDIYTNIRMKRQYYNRELIDLQIFGLQVTQKMLDLANEINKSTDVEDINMQSGYQSIQMIYIARLLDILENQKYSSQYLNKDLEILTDSVNISILRNKDWMDTFIAKELEQSLLIVIDSVSSDYIRKKYIELAGLL